MHPLRAVAGALDRTTMYRVVVYALLSIIAASFILAAFGFIAQPMVGMAFSLAVISAAAFATHALLARITAAPANIESSFITAGILFLILTPPSSVWSLLITAAIAIGAIALKYVVVYRRRHLFNPAALALFIAGLCGYYGVEWWVGTRYLLPVVLIAVVAVVMKIRRFELFFTYVALSTALVLVWSFGTEHPFEVIARHFLSWPMIFFAGIMLTEPLGLPGTRVPRYAFAGIVAILSSIPFAFGPIFGTPELALLVGNFFTFIVERPERFTLEFRRRVEVGPRSYEYHFAPSHPVAHAAGQYLEWTLPHKDPDIRGIRRYFTIVSPPGSKTVAFGIRHVEGQSSFKRSLEGLHESATVYATELGGDFTLRKNSPHHVLIAGGIGITPFVSMVRDAAATGEHIQATLFNCNKTEEDIIYRDELERAAECGILVIDVLVEQPTHITTYESGFLTEEVIKRRVAKWRDATYYLSGPPGLVDAYKKLLRGMGIKRSRIITDYFPGLA